MTLALSFSCIAGSLRSPAKHEKGLAPPASRSFKVREYQAPFGRLLITHFVALLITQPLALSFSCIAGSLRSPAKHEKGLASPVVTLGARSRFGLSSVVRCPTSLAGRAAVARRRLRPRRCPGSSTFRSGNRSRCRPPVSRLRTPPSLRSPFALGRAPRYTLPSGSCLRAPVRLPLASFAPVRLHARALAHKLPPLFAPTIFRGTRPLFLLRSGGQHVPRCLLALCRRPLALWLP